MLAIFGFRKNRSQNQSSQGPESEAELYGEGCHTVATAPTGSVLLQTYHYMLCGEDFSLSRGLEIQHNISLSVPP